MPRTAKNNKTTTKGRTSAVKKTTATKTVDKVEAPITEVEAEATVEVSESTPNPTTDFIVKPKPVEKVKHDPEELVSCRSVTRGELNLLSKKTGTLYVWADYGDVVEVQYQDLFPLVITKSAFIFNPYFVIEDSALLDEWWDRLGDVYTKIYRYDDIDAILRQSTTEFRNSLLNMPQGIKDAIKTSIATKIEEGTFDSLQKIKVVDEIMGTDLKCLVN